MKHSIYFFFLFLLLGNTAYSQSKKELQFNQNGQFKILQLTDLHWTPSETKECQKTKETIEKVIGSENPDFIIITGDIVTNSPFVEGWQQIIDFIASFKTPWAIVLGNHDDDEELNRDQIFELLKGKPYFIGEKGADVTGAGNYVLPIISSKEDKTAALLYCIDTQGKAQNWEYGRYYWMQHDQIKWYRAESKKYTLANNGTSVPAIAFFHIPLPEYNTIKKRYGHKREKVSSANINSGFFAALLDKKDVMATFCGHDHSNDFIGKKHGIALAYGRKSGFSGTSTRLTKGGRIILMYEGERKFDTWIRTPKKMEYKYSYR